MDFIVRFIIFIISYYGISTIYAQSNTVKPTPGFAGCMYYGSIDRCKEDIVPIGTLPPYCTSFFMDGLSVNEKFEIINSYSETDGDHIKGLTTTGKPVFISYGYKPWSVMLDCILNMESPCDNNLKTELTSVQNYLKDTKINGFVIKDVFEPDSTNLENISEKLKKYVDYMKCGNPGLLYGLTIDSNTLQSSTVRLDFNILSTAFDFFVITLDKLNECSKWYSEGVVPVVKDTGNTLTKLASILNNACVPKDKIYYMIPLSPQVKDHQGPGCHPTFAQKCKGTLNKNPNIVYTDTCMDTSLTYYKKGEFIKSNAAGFIVAQIDIDDVKNDCKCSTNYPAFNFILNGYNGGKQETCELFDQL